MGGMSDEAEGNLRRTVLQGPRGRREHFFFLAWGTKKTRLGYINTNLAQASLPHQSGQTRTTDASKGRRLTSYSTYGESVKWQT